MLLPHAGLIVLTAFISPLRADREQARRIVPAGAFIEVFVDCPLEICEQRDPKGLYAKARAGQIAEFTGVSAPYEPPVAPDVIVDTGVSSVAESEGFDGSLTSIIWMPLP